MSEKDITELIERAEREITELEDRLKTLKIVLAIKKGHKDVPDCDESRILDRGDDDPYYGVPV